MLTLYHFPSSVCAAKVRLVLQEKELPWESRIIEILKGEQFQPWYVALNPNAVVPTLVHDGEAICESAVICEYLDDAFPEPSMRPSDLVDRSVMRIWSSDVDTYMNGICAGITYPATHRHEILKLSPEDLQKFYDGHTDKDKLARRKRLIEMGYQAPDAKHAVLVYDKFLNKLEQRLAETGAWLAGDSLFDRRRRSDAIHRAARHAQLSGMVAAFASAARRLVRAHQGAAELPAGHDRHHAEEIRRRHG